MYRLLYAKKKVQVQRQRHFKSVRLCGETSRAANCDDSDEKVRSLGRGAIEHLPFQLCAV